MSKLEEMEKFSEEMNTMLIEKIFESSKVDGKVDTELAADKMGTLIAMGVDILAFMQNKPHEVEFNTTLFASSNHYEIKRSATTNTNPKSLH